MSDHDETAQAWEAIRERLGIAPEKWAAMNRAERRAAARATRESPRNRMVEQPGRNR